MEVPRVSEVASAPGIDAWLSLHSKTPTDPPSASERLIRALEAHASAEARDLDDCEAVAQRSHDPVTRLLIDMIVEDERRHHTLLQSMVRRLQEEVDFVPSPTALPIPTQADAAEPDLASAVRALIRDEHEGARHLRHIARQEPHVYDGLYALLLETIARDSEKHATILQFILHRSNAQG
jgi:rubrerythrin